MGGVFEPAGAAVGDVLFVILCHAVGKAEPGRKERAQQRLHARTLLWGPGRYGWLLKHGSVFPSKFLHTGVKNTTFQATRGHP